METRVPGQEEDLAVAHEKRYEELIEQLAEVLAVDANILKESGHLVVGSVHIGLINYHALDYGRITMFLDLGSIPAARQSEVHRRLLENNLMLPRTFGTYALIPDNGHGALVYHFDIFGGIDGQTLARIIFDLVDQYVGIERSLVNADRDSLSRRTRHAI